MRNPFRFFARMFSLKKREALVAAREREILAFGATILRVSELVKTIVLIRNETPSIFVVDPGWSRAMDLLDDTVNNLVLVLQGEPEQWDTSPSAAAPKAMFELVDRTGAMSPREFTEFTAKHAAPPPRGEPPPPAPAITIRGTAALRSAEAPGRSTEARQHCVESER